MPVQSDQVWSVLKEYRLPSSVPRFDTRAVHFGLMAGQSCGDAALCVICPHVPFNSLMSRSMTHY
jgi:hypothetical protein